MNGLQLLEFIRNGASVAELQDTGKHMLGLRQVRKMHALQCFFDKTIK